MGSQETLRYKVTSVRTPIDGKVLLKPLVFMNVSALRL